MFLSLAVLIIRSARRHASCSLGMFAATRVAQFVQSYASLSCDAAVVSAAAINQSVSGGSVTRSALSAAFNAASTIAVLQLTGAALVQLIQVR